MSQRRDKDEIRKIVEDELSSLSEVMDVSESMRKFNKLKYPQPKAYTARDIRRIRRKIHVSQSVLAYILNTKSTTIQKWELDINKPNGPASRLLQVIDEKGVKFLQMS
ncbi:MAG: transcriptional regulator [Candidatus Omnitrophica bacterium]|nr:transcriptional regulator [Candidatus Omnitrophota bacterium]